MKLHNYSDDALVMRLSELSAKATPGPWKSDPKRLEIQTAHGVVEGPVMSYLVGNKGTSPGMTVSLGSERLADHEFVAELVNAWRDGRLYCVMGEYTQSALRDAAGESSTKGE